MPVAAATVAKPAFRFLKDIAADLARGEIAFPTFAQATLKIRRTLDIPGVDAERMAQAISTEPLLAVRLVRMANSAAMGGGGKPIGDVKSAIVRLGHQNVRTLAISVAMEQLRNAPANPTYAAIAERAWCHSVNVAAMAFVLAKRLPRVNPDEALFAGLVHDIGHFYLLAQAPKYPEIEDHQDELEGLLAEWHPSIGQAVLHDFQLSEAVLEAVAEHEYGQFHLPPRTLRDVVVLANVAMADTNPVAGLRTVPPGALADPGVESLLTDARVEIQAVIAGLRG